MKALDGLMTVYHTLGTTLDPQQPVVVLHRASWDTLGVHLEAALDESRGILKTTEQPQPEPKRGPGAPKSGLLTPRELEALHFTAQGHNTVQVAQLMGLTQISVGDHLKNVRAKLESSSTAEACVKAVRMGLLDDVSEDPRDF